ncbi:acyltransferase family protein [Pyxidicoccus xibeiensis]|uniref:acyltransferase family protein n=1 Tax=Pyxidicoccus xibeiensis TaxID=2906759 RepID=UPI0020A80D61|nr:acyltransferase [Pyxidicoccus xibeiensis]MCP3144196.1 acyltransferase [Pyxidicoccus xibeiensis]
MSRRGGALDALTGLRFFAALHVVLFHFAKPCVATAPEGVRNWVEAGYSAVGVFFVLSGFVLAWNYLDADGKMQTPPRAFWAARVARVYPVYVLTFLLAAPTTIALSLEANGWKVAAVKLAVGGFTALALLQAWVPRLALYWNPPGWSVAVEGFFYALFPRLARGLSRLRPSLLPLALGAVWVLGLVPPLLYLWLLPDGPGPVDAASGGIWLGLLKFNPLLRLPEFVFGVLLGQAFVRERAVGAVKGHGAVLAAVGVALLVVAGAAGSRIAYPLMHNALLAPAAGLLVYGLARGGGPAGWLLSRPLLVHLGGASYALYLLQEPVSKAAETLAAVLAPWVDLATPVGRLATVLVLALPASVLVHRYVETPFRSRLRKALQPWVEEEKAVPARPAMPGA